MEFENKTITPQTFWNAAGGTIERINEEFREFNINHKAWDLIAMKINLDNVYNDVTPKVKDDTLGKKVRTALEKDYSAVSEAFKSKEKDAENKRWVALMELNRHLKKVMDIYGFYLPDKEVDDPTMAAYD